MNEYKKWIPASITAIRLILAPFLWAALDQFSQGWALLLFVVVAASDVLDGMAARRLGLGVKFGSTFDAGSDFVVLLVSFAILAHHGLYPSWLLLILVGMFAQFVISSRQMQPIYDPIGKHYGSILYVVLGITILFPEYGVTDALLLYLVLLTAASLGSRVLYMRQLRLNIR